MGVLSRVTDALEVHRDDDVVAECGLHFLGLLAEADENKVDVASALRRVFPSTSLGIRMLYRYALSVAAFVPHGCVCCGAGATHVCPCDRGGGAGCSSGAVGGR